MGACCAATNKETNKEGKKVKRPEVKNKEEFIIEKADFIGLNK